MSKRESKGQQVKSFQAFVPQPDMSKLKTIVKVFFKADEGTFYIYGPDHILDVVGNSPEGEPFRAYRGAISSATLDGVMQGFEWAQTRYFEILKSEQKRKVIDFRFEANRAWSDGPSKTGRQTPDGMVRNDMHFSGSPSLGVQYEILWEAGGQYYRQHDPDDPLQRASARGTVIEWTPEREAFFETMRVGLVSLIDRLIEFEADLKSDASTAIESIMSGAALLPPPSING